MDHGVLRIDVYNEPPDDPYVLASFSYMSRSSSELYPLLVLLAYRIWSVDRATSRFGGRRRSSLRPILHIVIDAGMIYSATLFAALMCFVNQSNGQYVVLDTVSTSIPRSLTMDGFTEIPIVIADCQVTPIISISFYMVIIRVGLASRTNQPSSGRAQTQPLVYGSSGNDPDVDQRNGMQVHIMTLTESKVERDRRQAMHPMTPMGSEDLASEREKV